MKPRISRLTLELYHRGLATRKERKIVEKALLSDISVQKRNEAIKEQGHEINRLVSKELNRLNISKTPAAAAINNVSIGWEIAAAAIIIIALVPTFLYLKHIGKNQEKAIVEVTTQNIDTQQPLITEVIPDKEKTFTPPPPVKNDKESSNKKIVIADSQQNEPIKEATEKEIKPDAGNMEFAAMPMPDTGVRLRGGGEGEQNNAEVPPEHEDNSGIPPGLTFIFENMFADKLMVGIVIPERIRSIAKNAYAGNPVLVVNIGANVDVHDEAIPGNFAKAYSKYGRQAGIYRRMNNETEEWKKMGSKEQ